MGTEKISKKSRANHAAAEDTTAQIPGVEASRMGAKARSRAAKRKFSRSHTRKEPSSKEYATDEDYHQAWQTWRELRDTNNDAVTRSRENKKRLLSMGCCQPRCLRLSACMASTERKLAIMIKAARSPAALSAAEQLEYAAVIASRRSESLRWLHFFLLLNYFSFEILFSKNKIR